jgi:hypothetical protein
MRETIENGHGLSDSHGGQWVEDNGSGQKWRIYIYIFTYQYLYCRLWILTYTCHC